MADFRAGTRLSGLMSRPYMNMMPVERMATKFGGMGIRSGAYGRAAAQYTAPLMARMEALRLRRGQEDAYTRFFREQERTRMAQKRQLARLQVAGGIAGDLAEYLAGRTPKPKQPMPVAQLSEDALAGLTERQKEDYRAWAAKQRRPRGDFDTRMAAADAALDAARRRRLQPTYRELIGGLSGMDYGEGMLSAALLRRLLSRGGL